MNTYFVPKRAESVTVPINITLTFRQSPPSYHSVRQSQEKGTGLCSMLPCNSKAETGYPPVGAGMDRAVEAVPAWD